jgi:hypothetical protein
MARTGLSNPGQIDLVADLTSTLELKRQDMPPAAKFCQVRANHPIPLATRQVPLISSDGQDLAASAAISPLVGSGGSRANASALL